MDVTLLWTVLVVDDEDGPREALRLVLERQFRVLLADGGEAALRILAKTPVDVVMLDLRMPGMSGIETLERIRELDPNVEVVVVTALPPYDVAWDCMRLRAFDVLRKPFSGAEILATAERAAASRSARYHDQKPTAAIAPLAEELVTQLEGMTSGTGEQDVVRYVRLLARCLRSLVQRPPELRLRDALESLTYDGKEATGPKPAR
jgi:DNA-binding NtrC family response regulator